MGLEMSLGLESSSMHIHTHTQTHNMTPASSSLRHHQPVGKGYTILFWKRSYLESITVQAPQPPSPQPSLVPLSLTGWSRVKEHKFIEGSLLGCWEVHAHSCKYRVIHWHTQARAPQPREAADPHGPLIPEFCTVTRKAKNGTISTAQMRKSIGVPSDSTQVFSRTGVLLLSNPGDVSWHQELPGLVLGDPNPVVSLRKGISHLKG